nr:hypothetical protein [Tanacetum cinerariifolium]
TAVSLFSKERIPFKRDPGDKSLTGFDLLSHLRLSNDYFRDKRDPVNNYITTPPTTPLETPPQTPLTSHVTNLLVIPSLAPQPIMPTTLAPCELIFTTPPTSPHLYLNTLEELPPRSTNPPPLPTFESIERLVSYSPPLSDRMDVEPSLPPSNLTGETLD